MSNEIIAMLAEAGDPIAQKLTGKTDEFESEPNMTEFPCGEFNEGNEFNGKCCNCGHPQEAHEFSVMENSTMQVTSDGQMSRLVGFCDVSKTLAPGLYVLRMSMSGFYLRHMRPFELPDKIYGDCGVFSNRVLKTFSMLNRGMGVLLSGEKGTGKTMTAKLLVTRAMKQGLPVIVIDQPFAGANVISFLDDLPNRCVFFIDEWEKIYINDGARKFFLGVLDGTCRSRHLWLMTTNTEEVGEFFISRPGRIRYHKKYEGLPEGFIRGIVSDKVKDEALREAIIATAQGIYNISPDVLMAMIEESVLHNETPYKFMDFFNVSPEMPNYDVEVTFRHVSVSVPQEVIMAWHAMGGEEAKKRILQMKYCQHHINSSREENDSSEKELVEALRSHYPDVCDFVVVEKFHTTKEWCDPFYYGENGKLNVNIQYLFYGDSGQVLDAGFGTKKQINFRIEADSIEHVIREGTKITVIAKNGDKVVARPAKKFGSKSSRWDRYTNPSTKNPAS